MDFSLFCPALIEGVLPARYGADDEQEQKEGVPQVSFPLQWANVPHGSQSLALVLMDYDNTEDEGVPWVHWLLADIPADWNCLPENASRILPGLVQGKNSWMLPYGPYAKTSMDVICHYGGPAPEKPHRYECSLLALDKTLEFQPGFTYNHLRYGACGHVLGQASLIFWYIPGGMQEPGGMMGKDTKENPLNKKLEFKSSF